MQRSAWLGTLTLLLCAGAAASAGCPNTSNTGLLPTTAVDVDPAQLLDGANLACGSGPGDIAEYAAIVNYQPSKNGSDLPNPFDCGTYSFSPPTLPLLAGGVYLCPVAGTFANLPLPNDAGALPDGGSVAFTLQVYFFTNAAFSADPNLSTDIASAVAPDGVTAGKACNALGKLQFSYATTCTAIEEDNIVVNAACNPIQCNPAGEFGCAAGGGDSGTEAGSLGTDAGDATTTDARAGADAPSGQDAAHDAGHDAPGGADVAIDGPHD